MYIQYEGGEARVSSQSLQVYLDLYAGVRSQKVFSNQV